MSTVTKIPRQTGGDVQSIRTRLFQAASVMQLIAQTAEHEQAIAGAAWLAARIVEEVAVELEGAA